MCTNLPECEEPPPRNFPEKGNHERKEKASAAWAQPIDVLPHGILGLKKSGSSRISLKGTVTIFRSNEKDRNHNTGSKPHIANLITLFLGPLISKSETLGSSDYLVLVLSDGQVAESGTHEKLVSMEGLYARM